MTTTSVAPTGQQSLLGGISSAFRINPFTGTHLEVRALHGATIETTDGRRYIGHVHGARNDGSRPCPPGVFEAMRRALGTAS